MAENVPKFDEKILISKLKGALNAEIHTRSQLLLKC